eukprot:11168965-Lingulodinium_polyedra.AAC.1
MDVSLQWRVGQLKAKAADCGTAGVVYRMGGSSAQRSSHVLLVLTWFPHAEDFHRHGSDVRLQTTLGLRGLREQFG